MASAKHKNRTRVYPKRLTSLSGIGDLHVKKNVTSSVLYDRSTSVYQLLTIVYHYDFQGIDSFISNNIKQNGGSPTDAYGEIEFGSDTSNTAKVRIKSSLSSIFFCTGIDCRQHFGGWTG